MAIDVGESVPSFGVSTLPDATGAEHDVAAELSGPTVVGLYKSSCQASKAMFPYLQRIHERYAGAGVRVLGVAQDSDNITRSFATRQGVTFPILIEGDAYPLSRAFDISATPTVYVIDQQGRVAYATMGFFQQQVEEMATAVATAIGVAPSPILTEADESAAKFVPG